MLIRFFWLEAFSPYALISPERFNPMKTFPLKELIVANTVAFVASICTRFSHLLAFMILFVVCYPLFTTAHSGSGSREKLAFLHSIHSVESAAVKATYLAQFSFLVYRLIKMHQFHKLRERAYFEFNALKTSIMRGWRS